MSGIHIMRRTRIRQARWEERKELRRPGFIRAFILNIRHECLHRTPKGRCACPGPTFVVWDGDITLLAQGADRYYVTCSEHPGRVYYRSLESATAAARDASFCPKCRGLFLRTSPCHMCGAPERGCKMCGT